MTSLLVGPVAAPPRIRHVPVYATSTGDEAVELAAMAGLHLDPQQQMVLRDGLGERADGTWAAFEVGVVEPRQNGKNSILEARELAGLFLLGERLLIHSAHQFDTSLEAFRRLLYLIESTPEFDRRVQRVSRSHGEEGIELRGGQRIRFRTRTKGGGRGFSGDFVAFDEAMVLPEMMLGAIMPVVSARPNPQVWYTGSAVDQMIHEYGVVLARLRARGMRGDDPRLAYFEWSVDCASPEEVTAEMAADVEAWMAANPALGTRISVEHVENERRAMDHRTFAVERLGVGDWPDPSGMVPSVIDAEDWLALADPQSAVVDPVCFALDVPPDRSSATIAVAGARPDGQRHVEVVDRRRGTGWVAERAAELVAKHKPMGFVLDGKSPAGSLVHDLEASDVTVTVISAAEHAQACGMLVDRVEQKTVRHLGTAELTAAVRGATRRPLGDAWAWSRKSSAGDISPLVASTLALWGSERIEPVKSSWRPAGSDFQAWAAKAEA